MAQIEKQVKMAHVFNIGVGVWSLKEGFVPGVLEFGGGSLGSRVGGLEWRVW